VLFIAEKNNSKEKRIVSETNQQRESRQIVGQKQEDKLDQKQKNKAEFKAIIGEAIASVRESSLGDLEQRIHFFQLVQENALNIHSDHHTFLKNNSLINHNSLTNDPRPRSRSGKSTIENKTEKKTSSDITSLASDSEDDLDTNNPIISIKYGLGEEEKLARDFYKPGSIDYIKLFYGDTGKIPPVFAQLSDIYAENSGKSDVVAETMKNEEATATFMEIQYAAVTGAQSSISFRERHRLDTWIKFNKDLFGILRHSVALTQDIDYSRVG